jgi:CBS domain-containing protein
MTIQNLLDQKGSEVVQASPHETARAALDRMIDMRVGSLLVLNDRNEVMGIVTERDILRRVVALKIPTEALTVEAIMTRDVFIVTPEDSLQRLMALMTQNRVRHMPVFSKGELVGLISIGDIVSTLLEQKEQENRFLRDYIAGVPSCSSTHP